MDVAILNFKPPPLHAKTQKYQYKENNLTRPSEWEPQKTHKQS